VYSLSSTGSIAPIFNIQDFTDADVEPRPNFYPPVPYTINTTSIYSVAVYYEQETQSTMVYYASSGGTYSELYKYSFHAKSKPITLLMEYPDIVAPIVVGSADTLYFATHSTLYMFSSSHGNVHYSNVDFPVGDRYRGLAVSVDGDRLLTTSSTDQADSSTTTGVYMVYPFMNYVDSLQTVLLQSSFAGAWFTCGDSLVSTVPQTTPEYGAKCPSNGFVGN